jgi:hypothetical protein
MPIYTFYPCRQDGSAATFEALELASDREARDRAARLLEQHPSCAAMVVWQGDRRVLALPRAGEHAPSP